MLAKETGLSILKASRDLHFMIIPSFKGHNILARRIVYYQKLYIEKYVS